MPDSPAPAPDGSNDLDFRALVALFSGIFRRHRRLLVGSVAICLGLAVAYWLTTQPLYNATTQLLVLPRGGRPLSEEGKQSRTHEMPEDQIPTQMIVLKSPRVVSHAIETVGLDSLPSLRAAKGDLLTATRLVTDSYLGVSRPDRNASIVRIDFRAGRRDEAIKMAGAIVASYQEFLKDHLRGDHSDLVQLLSKARDELDVELNKLERQYSELRRKNPLLSEDESGHSLIARRLERWDDAAGAASIKAAQLRRQVEVGETLRDEGAGLIPLAFALKQLGGDSGDSLLAAASGGTQAIASDYIRQLTQESQRVAEDLGPQYSKVRELQEQIGRTLDSARDSRKLLDRSDVDGLVASLKETLKSVEAMRAEFAEKFQQQLAEAREFVGEQTTATLLVSRLQRQRQFFTAITEQLKRAKFSSEYTEISAQVVEPPYAPGFPTFPRKKMILGVALLAGLVLGTGSALTLEAFKMRIHSPEELGRVLGCPVFGQVPRLAPHQVLLRDAGLVVNALPQSQAAEAYKEVRTHLERLRRKRPAQVIVVASPTSGEGASVTASNVAIGLAQAWRRVLLIDAALKKPSLHEVYDLDRENGLVNVLRDLSPAARLIRGTSIEYLDVLTAGPVVSQSSELLERFRFADLIREAKRDYDFVIIDSSPVLAAVDASIIAAQADGVLAVIDPDRTGRDLARKFAETLRAQEVPLMGVIMNKVDPREGSFSPRYGQTYADGIDGRPGPIILPVADAPTNGRAATHPAPTASYQTN